MDPNLHGICGTCSIQIFYFPPERLGIASCRRGRESRFRYIHRPWTSLEATGDPDDPSCHACRKHSRCLPTRQVLHEACTSNFCTMDPWPIPVFSTNME